MTSHGIANIEDLKIFVANGIPEGVNLEYKSSEIVTRRDSDKISKAICAFANAVGGQLFIGVRATDGFPSSLDDGVSGKPMKDWFYQVIQSTTSPVVTSVEVVEIFDSGKFYYVINVLRSCNAPHQSGDKKFYKRSGSISMPMEAYEIDDIRNRPNADLIPISVEILAKGSLAYLQLINKSQTKSILNIKCAVKTDIEFQKEGIRSLCGSGLKQLRPGQEFSFLLDSFFTLLQGPTNKAFEVLVEFNFNGSALSQSSVFYLDDYQHTIDVESAEQTAFKSIAKKIGDVANEIRDFRRLLEPLTTIADATGLRISQNTLGSLKNIERKFLPTAFSWRGYQELLNISSEEALKLYSVFWTVSPANDKKSDYEKLEKDLRMKFEEIFNPIFE